MNKLLLDESPLIVLPRLARIIGLNEALMLQQLHYLLQRDNWGKEHKGRKWVRMTAKEWQERWFGFWHVNTINRTMKNLQGKGNDKAPLVFQARLNEKRYDKTSWWTTNPQGIQLINQYGEWLPINQYGEWVKENPLTNMVKPIPKINTDNNKERPNGREEQDEKDLREIMSSWQTVTGVAVRFSEGHYKKFKLRKREYDGPFMKDLETAVQRIKDSSFLLGSTNKFFTFSWFLSKSKGEAHWVRVLDGRYEDAVKRKGNPFESL